MSTDVERLGGKGANLIRLTAAGLPVPAFVIVETDEYHRFVAHAGLRTIIDDAMRTNPATATTTIRQAFSAAAMAADQQARLKQVVWSLADKPVAVRSSATAEDLPGFSFAGQQDTFLGVEGVEDILRRIVDCWSSLWTERAISYRVRNGIDSDQVGIAVVVQEMVGATAAGVLFTANPRTGRRTETVIDAAFGLGDALVSGQVTPDTFVLDPATGRVRQQTLTGPDPTLDPSQLRTLNSLGRRIADLYAEPMDIEWVRDGTTLFIVQARPITSLYPLPEPNPRPHHEPEVWFSFGAFQGMLEPITPLGQEMIRMIAGAPAQIVGGLADWRTNRSVQVAGERIWIRMDGLLRIRAVRALVQRALPLIEPGTAAILAELAQEAALRPTRLGPKPRTVAGLLRLLAPALPRMGIALVDLEHVRHHLDRTVETFLSETQQVVEAASLRQAQGTESLSNRTPSLSNRTLSPSNRTLSLSNRTPSLSNRTLSPSNRTLSPSNRTLSLSKGDGIAPTPQARLTARIEAMAEIAARTLPTLLPAFAPIMATSIIQVAQLRRAAAATGLPDAESLAMNVLRSLPGNVTTEMDLVLADLAAEIRADARAVDELLTTSASDLDRRYRSGELHPVTQSAVAGFLAAYGMRGVGEIDLGAPRWRDDATPVLQNLKNYVQVRDPKLQPRAVHRFGAAAAERSVAQLAAASTGLGGRTITHSARVIRGLFGARETPKFTIVRAFGLLRDALDASAAELVAEGRIDDPADLYFLTTDELRRAFAGRWQNVVASRRAAFEAEQRRGQVPRVLVEDGRAFFEGLGAEGDLHGMGVSPGVAEGPVCVVSDPRESTLQPGDILVCKGTDPAWTPLFLSAAGLITEVGGLMTHGSVVAREYGIPAVVGVHDATRRLTDGQRVRIDGTSGAIELGES